MISLILPKSWNQVMLLDFIGWFRGPKPMKLLDDAVADQYLQCSVAMMRLLPYDFTERFFESNLYGCQLLDAPFIWSTTDTSSMLYPYTVAPIYYHTIPWTIYYHHIPWYDFHCWSCIMPVWYEFLFDSLLHFHIGLCVVPIGPQIQEVLQFDANVKSIPQRLFTYICTIPADFIWTWSTSDCSDELSFQFHCCSSSVASCASCGLMVMIWLMMMMLMMRCWGW